MKKLIFTLAIAAVLTSCSKDDSINEIDYSQPLEICGCTKKTFQEFKNEAGEIYGSLIVSRETLCVIDGIPTLKTYIDDNYYFTIICPKTITRE